MEESKVTLCLILFGEYGIKSYIYDGEMMLAVYSLCLALALYHRNKNTYIYFKALTSFTFVMIGIYHGYQNQNFMLVPTLLGFFVGDIMLATKLRRSFLLGMGGFFLADVCLVYELYHLKNVSVFDFLLSGLVMVFINVIARNPKMHLGHYKKPMYGYGLVLSLAVSNSIGCYVLYGTESYFLLALGMVFYFISDFLLMFQYFYKTQHRDKLKIAKMLFYFIGTYFIACSIGG